MPIDNPTALVEEFKKSGEFDRLRRELLARFHQDVRCPHGNSAAKASYSALKTRVEEIGRQKLTTDQMVHYVAQETIHKELTQEVERYPIVERAVADVRIFSDPTFLSSMQDSIQKILRDERGETSSTSKVSRSRATQVDKSAQDTHGSDNGAKHPAPVDTSVSRDSELPVDSLRLLSTDIALDVITSPQRPSGDDRTEADGVGVPSKGAVEPTVTSEPSSSAPNSNEELPIDDQRTMDVEVDDIRPAD
ncbi:hypothetical protein BDZ97DRAFT_1751156 [Flammula alnicola]|nr:hypothetical protein BDZ97DRAFT_1751156 [Flammula alnicola]